MSTTRLEHPCEGCLLDCNPITNKGHRDARFLVVGKPASILMGSRNENIPSASAKLFERTMHKAGFKKSDFVFTNAVRCGYDPDRLPTKDKRIIETSCREHLLRLIERMRPEVIIPMGADAAKAVYGRAVKITKVRGVPDFSEEHDAMILPIMDPAYVHIYPQHKAIFESDCRTLQRVVGANYDLEAVEQDMMGEYKQVYDLQFLIDHPPAVLSFDAETLGTRWQQPRNKILTMQFCTEEGKAWLISWDHPDDPASPELKAKYKRQLKQILQNPNTSVIGQNNKFDRGWVQRRLGFEYRIDHDTIMLASCVDENAQSSSLDTLTKVYVPEMAGYADYFASTYDKSRMDLVPLDKIVGYGCGDVDATLRVFKVLVAKVASDIKLWRYYRRVAMPGINAFASMEQRGLIVDENALDELEVILMEYTKRLRIKLLNGVHRNIKRKHKDAGLSFGRKDFLLDILFRHPDGFKFKPLVYTKTTQKLEPHLRVPSCSSKDHLPYFFEQSDWIIDLAEYIKLDRLLGTNIQSFRNKYITQGKIYPIYQLWVAVTGRTSCVRGDTPITTRRGIRSAADVCIGDELWTHRGRWRKVIALPPKPNADMYEVTLENGEVLPCTADHVVLLNTGEWTTIRLILEGGIEYAKCKQETDEGSGFGPEGSESVQGINVDGTAGSGRVWGKSFDGKRDDTGAYLRRGLQEVCALQVQAEQAGGEESSIWKSMGIRLRGWAGVPDPSSRGEEVLCTPNRDGGSFRTTSSGIVGIVDSSSHRRRPKEQSNRQSGLDHQGGACSHTPEVPNSFIGYGVTKIEFAGSSGVYDFTVNEDESYLACGVFSHNSRDPNGQNFPKRGEFAKAYRKIFVPPPGYVMIEADLSQAELRISGDAANDKTMIRIYQTGGDIHKETACIVMGVTLEQFNELSKEERDLARFKAKAVNFGFIYGMGWRKFIVYAKTQYGVEFSENEAKRIRSAFFRKYKSLPLWHTAVRDFAAEYGYVRSYDGRIRHLPMVDSDDEGVRAEAGRQAINSPVQNFASDLGVMSVARLEQEVDPRYLAVVGFVHDAIYALVPEEYLEWGAKTLKHYMETNPLKEWFDLTLKVPIIADVGFGWSGGDTFEMKGLSQNEMYDFNALEEAYNVDLDLATQKVPPRAGRRQRREYMEISI